MEFAASGQAGSGAQRGRGPAVDFEALASSKKNARRRRAWVVFQDESGISQQPSVRRTWAPKGETPVLTYNFNWKKMSLGTALAYHWDGRQCRLIYRTCPGSYNSSSLIEFLKRMKQSLGRRKVTLVWDGLPAHRSRLMTDYLHSQRHWLRVEKLPGYAPDLNPVENVWGSLKEVELANRCVDNLQQAVASVRRGMARIGRSKILTFAFLRHARLSF